MRRYILIGFLMLTACGKSGSAPAIEASPSTPAITQPGGGGSTPSNDPALTYYTLVSTESVSNAGGPVYHVTVTGHCVQYQSHDYCWDDGWQKVAALNYETDFWGLCDNGGSIGQCSGGSSIDPVTQPTLWQQPVIQGIVTPNHQPSDVYTGGIATQVNCTITGSVVDCVDFQIDTAQAPL